MRVVFLGDIFAEPGRNAVKNGLRELIEKYKPNFVVANGENAAHGAGITYEIALEIHSYGVDVITGGNHTFDKKVFWDKFEMFPYLLRPANFPLGALGKGHVVIEKGGLALGVLNLQGRVEMQPIDSPFEIGMNIIKEIRKKTSYIIVDFHAEATAEKEALGYYFDGMVSAVVGTHTHVQTADEKILPNGTAYISDVGMCGVEDSVIGLDKEIAIKRFTTGMPWNFKPAEGSATLHYVVIDIDSSGLATQIERGKWKKTSNT
ncbi:MAG: TIGR00282 family metallophosphoesterase [Caldisericaceae bacterium]